MAESARDLVEVLAHEKPEQLARLQPHSVPVAFHSPCTLQHGQHLNGAVEQLLGQFGVELTLVSEPYLCCGSAGTYSLLQAELSEQLKERKLRALEAGEPGLIATANIGCLLQLRNGARVPVVHWIQLLDREL